MTMRNAHMFESSLYRRQMLKVKSPRVAVMVLPFQSKVRPLPL